MKLRLNVATAPQENNRPFIAGAMFIGVAALIALVYLAHAAYDSRRANVTLRNETAQLEQRIQADEAHQQDLESYFNRPDVKQIRDRADFLNSLIGQRAFPWTKIFMDLEKTLPPGVRVVSISPKLIDGRADVSMVVGAQNDDAKLKFLEAVEKSPSFSGVTVDDEKVSEQQQANDPDRILVRLDFWYETT
jgi:Tfp pilus assembly protein PilN